MGSDMDKVDFLTGTKVKLKSRGASPLPTLGQMAHTHQGRLLPRVWHLGHKTQAESWLENLKHKLTERKLLRIKFSQGHSISELISQHPWSLAISTMPPTSGCSPKHVCLYRGGEGLQRLWGAGRPGS